jgi:hypothetical protein
MTSEKEKGHIRGVPFTDVPRVSKLPKLTINEYQVIQLRCQIMQAQIDRLTMKHKWSMGLSAVSIVISVIILAAHFVH